MFAGSRRDECSFELIMGFIYIKEIGIRLMEEDNLADGSVLEKSLSFLIEIIF